VKQLPTKNEQLIKQVTNNIVWRYSTLYNITTAFYD